MKNPSVPIETEVKIRVADGAGAARKLIESHGYHASVPRTLQVDQVYDFPDRALRDSGRLLRVRSEGEAQSAILTFKGPVISNHPHKSREELETSAESAAVLADILKRLGMVPSFRYEKYRTTFVSASDQPAPEASQQGYGLIALDETPIGVFLELEGSSYWIDRVALKLGFGRDDYITASYAALYREHLAEHPGPPDMTFLSRDLGPSAKDS